MSNKILDKNTFKALWEKIKMIKAFEFAEEIGYEKGYDKGQNDGYDKGQNDGYDKGKNDGYDKGKNDGYDKGKNEGALHTAKMMLIEILEEMVGVVPEYIDKKIQQIASQTTLKGLLRQATKCRNYKDFDHELVLAI
jgi:flagellar biosynthesis/type III secretory pathway protein FliH